MICGRKEKVMETEKQKIMDIAKEYPYTYKTVEHIFNEVQGNTDTVKYVLNLSLQCRLAPSAVLGNLRKGLEV